MQFAAKVKGLTVCFILKRYVYSFVLLLLSFSITYVTGFYDQNTEQTE